MEELVLRALLAGEELHIVDEQHVDAVAVVAADCVPETDRSLDLQGLLWFALRRVEAPSLEPLVTDLARRGGFA